MKTIVKKILKNKKWRYSLMFSTAVAVPFIILETTIEKKEDKVKAGFNQAISSSTSQIFGNDFFPIFKDGVQTKNVHDMGEISSFKIAGLPFSNMPATVNGTPRKINLNNVELVDAANHTELSPVFVSLDGSSQDDKMTMQKTANAINVENATETQAVEFNYVLPIAKVIDDIELAVDLSNSQASWGKIGEIEILLKNGDVYRADNVPIASLKKPGVPSDGSVNDISLNLVKNWYIWSKQPTTTESSFMWSYERDFTYNNTDFLPYFYNGIKTRRSVVPIIDGGKSIVSRFKEDGQIAERVELSQELTQGQKMAFFKEINDVAFVRSFTNLIGLPSNTLDNISWSQISNYDVNASKNVYLDNSKVWNLDIVMDGSSTSLDRMNISNLQVLSDLTNVRKLSFRMISLQEQLNNWYNFMLDDLTWISSWRKLENLEMPSEFSENWNNKYLNIKFTGSLSKIDFIEKLVNLRTLDISSYKPLDSIRLIDELVSANWYNTFALNFKIWLPKDVFNIINANQSIKDVFTISKFVDPVKNFEFTIITKKVSSGFVKPEIVKSNNNAQRYEFSKMVFDGQNLNVMVRSGKFYWNFIEKNLKPEDVKYTNNVGEYFSEKYIQDNNIDKATLKEISQIQNYYDGMPSIEVSLKNDGLITSQNFPTINQKIFIDDVEVSKVVFDSMIMYNYDISKVKFGLIQGNETLYFTSLDSVISHVSLEKIGSTEIFDLVPRINGADFAGYLNLTEEDKKLPDPENYNDKNEITIDDQKYNDVIVNGNLMWKLENIDISRVLYRQINTKKFYTSPFKQNGDLLPNLISINAHNPYPVTPKLEPAITNPGPIVSLSDMDMKIRIDDVDYPVTLVNGELEYQVDVSNVSYVRHFVNQKGEIESEYFTLLSKVSRSIPLSEISSIERTSHLLSPSIVVYNSLPLLKDSFLNSIIIDGVKVESKIRNGKIYYIVDPTIFDSIKFKDSNNNYYTELLPSNFRNPGMTSVTSKYDYVIDNQLFTFPQNINSNNYKMVNYGVIIAGEKEEFVVKDGAIYLSDKILNAVKFATRSPLGIINYYFDISSVPEEELASLWSVEVSQTAKATSLVMPLPDERQGISSPYEELVFYDKRGNKSFIPIIYNKSQDAYLYTNYDLIKRIRFRDSFGNYFESLIDSMKFEGVYSIDMKNSNLIEKAVPLIESDLDVPNSSKQNGLFIGLVSGVLLIAISSTWAVLSIKKRKGK